MRIGIDASNLRGGGGRTHLLEILRALQPETLGISEIRVWGAQDTLVLLPERPWLHLSHQTQLDGRLMERLIWQKRALPRLLTNDEIDILYSPGAGPTGGFHPCVSFHQNLLPFEWKELRRFGFSRTTLRLLALRLLQKRAFRRANGVIFLSGYARQAVEKATGSLSGRVAVIPHGVGEAFRMPPRPPHRIEEMDARRPFKIVYVSTIAPYKHQWRVIAAIGKLRLLHGWPLTLQLVGGVGGKAQKLVAKAIAEWDPEGHWVSLSGEVPYAEMPQSYREADLAIMASTSETQSIALIEAMAAGLPVACSERSSLPEFLGDAGVYFDPEDETSIAAAISGCVQSPELRLQCAERAFMAAAGYDWRSVARQTFEFVVECKRDHVHRRERHPT